MKRQTLKTVVLLIIVIIISTGIQMLQIHASQQSELNMREKLINEQSETIETLSSYKDIIDEQSARIDEQLKTIDELKQSISELTDKYEVVVEQNRQLTDKVVYLTFDDGPSKEVTQKILDILSDFDVKATFFVQGRNVDKNKDVLKAVSQAGHAIGNHSYSHRYEYIYKNEAQFWEDFNKAQDKIYEVIGTYPEIFRFPGGSSSAFNLLGEKQFSVIANRLIESGMQYFDWNIDSGDAASAVVDVGTVRSNAFAQIVKKKNAIALFHDTDAKMVTVNVLPEIIEHYLALGYRFDVLKPNGFTYQQRVIDLSRIN